jgi:DNA-binding protein HU-beta
MNKGELVSAVADKVGLKREQASQAIEATLDSIAGALTRGEEVKLVGFGSFVVTKRAAGEARNPRTGETVKVEESMVPKFKAGAGLRQAVNDKSGA